MFVVQVTPMSKRGLKGTLSFFSKTKFEVGSVVTVPVRGKATPAVVVSITDVRTERQELRESSFALKKITSRTSKRVLPSAILEGLRDSAIYHALPIGALLAHFTPSVITDSLDKINNAPVTEERVETTSDALVLQAESEERVRMYRNIAREAFARGTSIILIAPTSIEAENLYEKLHRGIEEQVVLITSSITKKAILSIWNRATTDPEPLLIVTTPSFLAIPRSNVGAYIIERESARTYRGFEQNAIDARITAEYIAKKQGARIIYADFPLRVTTRNRLQRGELEELMRMQVSAQNRTPVSIIDARKKETENQIPKKKRPFSVFTEQAEHAIRKELERGGRVFVFAQRKGLAPLTVCNDCGTPITDPSSDTPMTLHKTEKGNVFMSYRSGAVVPANISCKQCTSWNLVSLGIGVERVIDEAQKLFKKYQVFSITADNASTHSKAKKIQKQFFEISGALLIGTERALPYLTEPVDLSVVASIDSLLSISAWRAHEYALTTLFYLRDHTQGPLFVQTRNADSSVMRALASGNPTDFIREELKEREQFGYPPFTTFIGLTWTGTERAIEKTNEIVRDVLKDWEIIGPLPPRYIGKNRYIARAVIRLESGKWPHHTLRGELLSLPPEVHVSVDPDEIV